MQFNKQQVGSVLTPEAHKDGEEDGGWIVKQVGEPRKLAAVDQSLVTARLVALRTERYVSRAVRVADFFTETKQRHVTSPSKPNTKSVFEENN